MQSKVHAIPDKACMDIEIAFLKMVVNLCVWGNARAKQRILLSGEMCYAVLCILLPFLFTALFIRLESLRLCMIILTLLYGC